MSVNVEFSESLRGQLLTLPDICNSFPEPIKHELLREAVVRQIDDSFKRYKVVTLDDGESSGRTTLLSQFAREHPKSSISLFLKPSCRQSYLPNHVFDDLGRQMYHAAEENPLDVPDYFQEADLSWLITRLSLKARQKTIYFIVDGLMQIPKEDESFVREIVRVLPLGMERFRFLFSGPTDAVSALFDSEVKPLSIPYLHFEEALHFFQPKYEKSLVENIYKVFKTVADLSAVRRVLDDASDPREVVSQWPSRHPDLLRLQWQAVDKHDADQTLLLSLLSHIDCAQTIGKLSEISELASADIRQKLGQLSFISIGSEEQGGNAPVSFVAEQIRECAANRLTHEKVRAEKLFLNYLRAQDDDVELTDYLEQVQYDEELVTHLNSERLVSMLDQTGSLAVVQRKATAGIDAAVRTNRINELMNLSIQKSALTGLNSAKVWRSEIEACVALNDYDAALVLAQSAILLEDRLHQLAVIAKAKHRQKQPLDPLLDDLIQGTFNRIDPTNMSGDVTEIAADLLPTHPELALSLVEKSQKALGANSLDWAFARLSVQALADDESKEKTTVLPENLQDRITNPQLQQFLSVTALVYGYGKFSGAEIIAETEKLNNTNSRVFVLRQWAVGNAAHPDTALVLDHAISVLVGDASFIPAARDLRQLAAALPQITDLAALKALVLRFDSQLNNIKARSSTEDEVSLSLLIAEAEARFDFEAARSRVTEVYWYLDDLKDIVIKSACLARLVSALKRLDFEEKLEASDKLHSLSRNDLEAASTMLLNATADHQDVIKNIIRPLARTHSEWAFSWIAQLNTLPRRDGALLDFVRAACAVPYARLDFDALFSALKKFEDEFWRDEALSEILRRLDAIDDEVKTAWDIKPALPLINQALIVSRLDLRCLCLCLNISVLSANCQRHGNEEFADLRTNHLDALTECWGKIPVLWNRVNIGFQIAVELSESLPNSAAEFKREAELLRGDAVLSDGATARTYLACLYLGNRAFAGFCVVADDAEWLRLQSAIELVPSPGERVGLWTDLALRAYDVGENVRAKTIVDNYLRNDLTRLKVQDRFTAGTCVAVAAAALFKAHPGTAFQEISVLSDHDRDAAYQEIARYLLQKKPPADPVHAHNAQSYRISYDEAVDICQILTNIESDSIIHRIAEDLCNSVMDKRNIFTREQKNEICALLENVVQVSLRDKISTSRYIRHEGYILLAEAQIVRLRSEFGKRDLLIDRAKALPNQADQAFVLCQMAVILKEKDSARHEWAESVLAAAADIMDSIPTAEDKLGRYEMLAESAHQVSNQIGKKYLKRAMEATRKFIEGDPNEEAQERASGAVKKLLDIAYRIGGDFAAQIATLADDDPARTTLGPEMNKQVKFLELRDKIAKEKCESEELYECTPRECSRIASNLLGKLNAGRLSPWHTTESRDFVRIASRASLRDSYPILCWVIENTVQRRSTGNNDEKRNVLHPLFHVALRSAELSLGVAMRTRNQLQTLQQQTSGDESFSCILSPGQEGKGKSWIEAWIKEEVGDNLRICDPYLSLDDICELLLLVHRYHPNCSVEVLTCRKTMLKHKGEISSWSQVFRDKWRHLTDNEPPQTLVIVAAIEPTGNTPIHDRWFLSGDKGMMNGTSVNGIANKVHHLRRLPKDEVANAHTTLAPYFARQEKWHNNEEITYKFFSLE